MTKEIAKGKYAAEGEAPTEAPPRLPRASDPDIVRQDGTINREKLLVAIGAQATGMVGKLLDEREHYRLGIEAIIQVLERAPDADRENVLEIARAALNPVK